METIKAFYKDDQGYYCDPDPTKNKFYYEEGKTYKMNKKDVKLCRTGFHASANFDISETLFSYKITKSHYGIVELNVIEKDSDKAVGNKIKILEFLPNDFNVLSKYDKTGAWIYSAGKHWEQFDYKLGFQKLLELDKTGEWIFNAGINWKQFDYELGLKRLFKVDKTGEWIYFAGRTWKQFDHKLGFKRLLEVDKTGKWISKIGISWK